MINQLKNGERNATATPERAYGCKTFSRKRERDEVVVEYLEENEDETVDQNPDEVVERGEEEPDEEEQNQTGDNNPEGEPDNGVSSEEF